MRRVDESERDSACGCDDDYDTTKYRVVSQSTLNETGVLRVAGVHDVSGLRLDLARALQRQHSRWHSQPIELAIQ